MLPLLLLLLLLMRTAGSVGGGWFRTCVAVLGAEVRGLQ